MTNTQKITCKNCHKDLDDPPNEEGYKFQFVLCGECHDILFGGDNRKIIQEFRED